MNDYRIENDSMGELKVPTSSYYGAQTMRAIQNFPISDLKFQNSFIKALAQIKLSAAEANFKLTLINEQSKNVIVSACQDIIAGKMNDQFVLDIFQTGSGTSTNMNINEVISNKAIEILGGEIGSKKPIHPNDHVNMGQSSNDVIPSAIHLSAISSINEKLLPSLKKLNNSLLKKSEEFMDVVKTGRTHLQDATPIRLGQEFLGYAGQIERSAQRISDSVSQLSEIAIGGTAVGTGVNTHPQFAKKVCEILTKLIKVKITETDNHFQAQSTLDTAVACSGSLKSLAIALMKISNDIRWLSSGPRSGFNEIEIPAVQPGSSIMPGKINPVIPESVCQVSAQIIGNDTTISIAGQSGNFEINVMMPVVAYNLLQSIELASTSCENFTTQCIDGIKATQKGPQMVTNGLAIVTTLVPHIGYDKSAHIAKLAQLKNLTIKEIALQETNFSSDELDNILNPESMTDPESAPNVSLG
ncbi:MAG: class II fumarate hydratase [SAR202 cluster bacterium]|nr:class II fumarate hydratase [SAR202 cluster bacterium]|tara:strand:+ start:90069 stop:91481 length:1413 start_codon:yes stop_codon:yes gene_type:complete